MWRRMTTNLVVEIMNYAGRIVEMCRLGSIYIATSTSMGRCQGRRKYRPGDPRARTRLGLTAFHTHQPRPRFDHRRALCPDSVGVTTGIRRALCPLS